MNKKIWIINQYAGKLDSGWGERHYYLSSNWIKKDYDVVIFSASFNHLFSNQPELKNDKSTLEEIKKNLKFYWIKVSKYNPKSIWRILVMIQFSLKVLFMNKKKIDSPDIILISSMPIFSLFTAWLLSLRYKSKLIFEVRDLWPQTPIHLKGYSRFHPMVIFMGLIEKLGYRKADYIVSLLPNAHHYINKISKDPLKFKYIPNGIETKNFIQENYKNVILEKISKEKFIVGYAGTLGLANAMEYFIEASILMKDKNNIHFIIVGDGYLKEEYMEKTMNNSNITFINKVKKSQVIGVLKYFDVCYVGRYNSPLYMHGVSYNKYFDYMFAKKPILESSAFINDPVELSDCGLIVEPECAESICAGINTLFNLNESERIILGEKGYKFCMMNHTYEKLSKDYLSILE